MARAGMRRMPVALCALAATTLLAIGCTGPPASRATPTLESTGVVDGTPTERAVSPGAAATTPPERCTPADFPRASLPGVPAPAQGERMALQLDPCLTVKSDRRAHGRRRDVSVLGRGCRHRRRDPAVRMCGSWIPSAPCCASMTPCLCGRGVSWSPECQVWERRHLLDGSRRSSMRLIRRSTRCITGQGGFRATSSSTTFAGSSRQSRGQPNGSTRPPAHSSRKPLTWWSGSISHSRA